MNISKLTLGTAQLGQQYGIANTTGKPSERNAHEIISVALHNGIKCIDTAPVYGNSEEIVGSYLHHRPSNCTVVTKLPHCFFENGHSFKEVYPVVKSWLNTSLSNLKMKYIPIYLVRDVSQLDIIYDSLRKLKMDRLIEKIGVSIYDVDELDKCLKYDEIEVFQIPINLFDHRFIPYLPKLKGKIVFARSIFLQGLFLMDRKELPKWAKKPIKKLSDIVIDHGIAPQDLAVSFVKDLPNITSLVIGAETTKQVLDNVWLVTNSPLDMDVTNCIMSEFADMPLEVIDPRKWSK
jgi:aryl-alcohol dehydrogenase-like predicted oxidoreductase